MPVMRGPSERPHRFAAICHADTVGHDGIGLDERAS